MSPPPTREDRFRALYAELRPQLLRFVHRRHAATGTAAAEDVVADAFLVMWRRLEQAPTGLEDVRAWAYGITRNVLLNQARGQRRHLALSVRLAEHHDRDEKFRSEASSEADGVVNRVDLTRAWQRLSAVHQEALSLVVFDGLDSSRAASVLGISAVAFRLRLSRARRALRLHLDHPPLTSRRPSADPAFRSIP
ncbi:RNA polymerase sigma factor [Kineococcus radiotolerans]|nr:sigma-70 family RNA polymerase sigma factor [Kineococcus radiotolerans]